MGRPIERLSAVAISKLAKQKGTYCDGGGLYLRSEPPQQCSWLFRYCKDGKERWMGIGPYPTIALADARVRAAECRRLLAHGKDPVAERDAERTRARLEAAKAQTFRHCAESYIAAHKAAWRASKHRKLWENTLATYVYPVIGSLPAASIDTSLVLKVLEPIWITKTETASRIRQRIEAALDWATARGYRVGDNPARWRGHLDKLLPAQSKVRKVEHHAALPYDHISDFMKALRAQEGMSARAFEFAILTAARTGEVIGARWNEIDLKNKVWTIPGERMKAGREHRVPLSDPAMAILEAIRPAKPEPEAFAFPGARPKRPLSNMAFLMLLRRMARSDLTGHGFRSTFRDWCAERTNYPSEVAEMALAHTVGNKVEAAYRRGDLFEKRRRLMADWASYCASTTSDTANVVPIREAVS